MPSTATVYRWELFKLRHQKRTYIGLGASIIVPILFVLAIHLRHHNGRGGDFAFSSYLDRSGLAVPLVILLFGAVWMFPLITALVAGDIFASEDHNGTLKTIFMRSLERWQIFAGKALAASTYAAVNIIPQTFELGGKSANIVCPTPIFNKGEVCFAGTRVFVHRTV